MNKNPFIEGSPVIYEGEVSKELLIKGYKKQYNVEVESLLSPAEKISIFRCKESGYRFYYPFEITGDSKFYEKLQENEWYYMPWKWEHQVCNKFIKENTKILEVGCGKGDFLRKVKSEFANIDCVGLELNQSSVSSEKKLQVICSTIEDFSLSNEGVFDIVCSFQVLEHVPTVNCFLKANIRCLKEDGLLVISVPNNNSFIKYEKHNLLNMPPHHMGLWSEKSLRKIGEYFNLELADVIYEPLQEYHFDWYTYLIIRKFTGRRAARFILKAIGFLKLKNTIRKYLKQNANKIKGHSILVVFRKIPIGFRRNLN